MRTIAVAAFLALAAIPAHAQVCDAFAHDAHAMALRRDLGMGPQPGAYASLRHDDPPAYEIERQMTADIYGSNISPSDAAALSRRVCGWTPLQVLRAEAPASEHVDPVTGWNHRDRSPPGPIPCEKMFSGAGASNSGAMAACRTYNNAQPQQNF